MIPTLGLSILSTVLWLSGVSAYATEEQALLNFAGQLSNLKEIAAASQWQGWGLDNNELCPSTQISTTQELLCEPGYPGGIEHASQSWTGVTCTPDGYVICLSLPGWGLSGNGSSLLELAMLTHMEFLNLADNNLTGTLPADLPNAFRIQNAGACWLSVVYLSNNSISGSLPAAWGDVADGWAQSMQRLYLSDNQITGQLPQQWSDDSALYELGRLDLYGNKMTGSIPWTAADLPHLANLVLLPGNNFCGDVPQGFDGIVRQYAGSSDIKYAGSNITSQVLANVTSFNATCRPADAGVIGPVSYAVTIGGVFAAVAGALAAILLWWFLWRHKAALASKSQQSLPGIAKLLSWHRNRTSRSEWQSSSATSSSSTDDSEAARLTGKMADADFASCNFHAGNELGNAHSLADGFPPASSAKTETRSGATVYFTTRPVMFEVSNVKPGSWSSAQHMQQMSAIPAPLWQDVEIAPEHISIAQTPAGTDWMLGQGSYGTVYKGVKDGIHDVAIKVFKSVSTERDFELLHTEIAILRSCNNRNIVHFYGVCFKQDDAWLVMELLEKGNLYNALAYGKGLCTWYKRGAGIALDIAKGLHFLHSHHVMHLDLKSPNILLAQDGTAKIADVGLSRIFTTCSLPVAKNTGTFHWMAPELISAGRCTEKADIFSFGVVLYEILTAEQPIRGRLKTVQAPEHCPQAVVDLMTRCQHERPERRPSAVDIVRVLSDYTGLKKHRQQS